MITETCERHIKRAILTELSTQLVALGDDRFNISSISMRVYYCSGYEQFIVDIELHQADDEIHASDARTDLNPIYSDEDRYMYSVLQLKEDGLDDLYLAYITRACEIWELEDHLNLSSYYKNS